ncbi:MAG: archease [Spirochaetia bacterium]
MGYAFPENVPQGDAAFRAWGKNLDELFKESGNALFEIMAGIRPPDPGKGSGESREINLAGNDPEILLFDFLNEILYYKDAESVLLQPRSVRVSQVEGKEYRAAADTQLFLLIPGEQRGTDVKAVTLYRFYVKKINDGWEAGVLLDT